MKLLLTRSQHGDRESSRHRHSSSASNDLPVLLWATLRSAIQQGRLACEDRWREQCCLSHDAKPLCLSDFRPLHQVHIARVRPSCASAHRSPAVQITLPSTFLSLFSGNFAPDNTFLFIDLSVYGTIHIAFPLLSSLQHHRAFRDPIPSTTYIPGQTGRSTKMGGRRAPSYRSQRSSD